MIRAGDLTLTGRISPAPGALAAHVAAYYGGFDLVDPMPGGGIRVTLGNGAIHFAPDEGGLTLAIIAVSAGDLFVLREAVVSLVEGSDPALAARILWDRPLPRGAHPPNFRLARVLGTSRPGPRYVRLRLGADNLAPFALHGFHLRLLLPPEGRAPVWPRVAEDGRTRWPEGADAPHDPAYTVRAIDPVAGWMDVDIYLHGRGRACHWARIVRPDAMLGLVGPGGGGLPPGRHLTLAGDETALPALARILQEASTDTTGTALILVPTPEDRQQITAPKGMCLRWLFRSDGATLTGALADLPMPREGIPGGRHLWIATERTEASRLRARYRVPGLWGRSEATIAAYWTDTDV